MDVTSQDILNLTAAFEKLQANRHIGSGHDLNTKYRDLVLPRVGNNRGQVSGAVWRKGELTMDYKGLAERLRTESLYKDKATLEIMDMCMDAAAAITELSGKVGQLEKQLDEMHKIKQENYQFRELTKLISVDCLAKIVRCKDCKNNPDIGTRTKGMLWCRKWRSEVRKDDFCSYAERKDGGTE